jgi:hypothetical protein
MHDDETLGFRAGFQAFGLDGLTALHFLLVLAVAELKVSGGLFEVAGEIRLGHGNRKWGGICIFPLCRVFVSSFRECVA